MTILEGQMAACMAQVLYWHASVISGAYKTREISRGCGKNKNGTTKFKPLTDEGKLKDSMRILQQHVHRIWELIDHIAGHPGGGTP